MESKDGTCKAVDHVHFFDVPSPITKLDPDAHADLTRTYMYWSQSACNSLVVVIKIINQKDPKGVQIPKGNQPN